MKRQTRMHTHIHTLFIYENTAMKHFSLPTKWNQLIRFTSLNDNRVYVICIIIYTPPKVKYMHIFTTTTYRKEICKLSTYITHEYLPPPIFIITNGAFMTSFQSIVHYVIHKWISFFSFFFTFCLMCHNQLLPVQYLHHLWLRHSGRKRKRQRRRRRRRRRHLFNFLHT